MQPSGAAGSLRGTRRESQKGTPGTFGILKEDTSETSPMRQVFLAVPSKASTFGILIENTFHINRPPKVVSFSKGPSQPLGFSRGAVVLFVESFSRKRNDRSTVGTCARPLPLCDGLNIQDSPLKTTAPAPQDDPSLGTKDPRANMIPALLAPNCTKTARTHLGTYQPKHQPLIAHLPLCPPL